MTQRGEVVEASNDGGCPPQSEDLSIKSFNLLSSKQSKNIYSISEELALQAENQKAYMNEYQEMLFDFMNSLPLVDGFKDELHKLVLASEINSVQAFHKAKNVMVNLANDIADGTLTISKTIRSVFVGAYNKAIERSNRNMSISSSVEEEPLISNAMPFYDWLNEKPSDWRPVKSMSIYMENWLEW